MRKRRGRALRGAALCVLAPAVLAATALAAAGDLDQSFSGDGKRTFGFANGTESDSGAGVAIQADGKIVLVGGSSQGGQNDFAVARLNPGGGLDQSFSTDGRRSFGFANAGAGDAGFGVAIQQDGKIVVVGYSDQNGSGRDFAVARLNPNGALDPTFSTDGRRTFGFGNGGNLDAGFDVAVQPNGKIVVAGESDQGATLDDFAVARLNPNGSLDQSFSNDGRRTFGFANGANSDSGHGLAIQPNDKIVVVGSSFEPATGTDFALARLNPNGSLDQGFSGDGRRILGFGNGAATTNVVEDVALQQDGRIVAAGRSEQPASGFDFALARLNPGGGLDNSFSTDGRRTLGFGNGTGLDSGTAVAPQATGKIVVAGRSEQGGTGSDFALALLNPGGGLDQSFSTDGRRTFGFANGANFDSGSAVAVQASGKIVVAGSSIQSGTGNNFAVARLLGG